MSDISDSDSIIECGICECFEDMVEYTPCCHEPVCDNHNTYYPFCSIKGCDDSEMCKICIDINSFKCKICKKTFCNRHNKSKYLCKCK